MLLTNPYRHCKLEVLKKKEEEEQKARQERIKKRAEELLASAQLPLNMERINSQTKKKKYEPEQPSFKPTITKYVPIKHPELKEDEEKPKTIKPRTEIKPFSFDVNCW